ncbi:hypothetical protein BTN49_1527 [Candidatus Enterovibrio escicola]|uniref:Uncharacterized protein n=1 Tax=Candidatus Enterovibrio escicola TaxID=1927127 RepID=A0A2A5T477_9GAMM|nr:hypothetical protein BTN49_1527 [Candidatus Enterovibrio escacola]
MLDVIDTNWLHIDVEYKNVILACMAIKRMVRGSGNMTNFISRPLGV